MSDERMQPLLEAWFKDRDVTPHDVRSSTSRVMARVPQVRQRSRWWPLPVFHRPVSTFPGREPEPAPIPATDGRQPARGFRMFSAVKFVVAGVIVALFSGFLLAGVLTTQQEGEVAPAAVTASPAEEATSEPTKAPTTSVRSDILPGVDLTVEEVEPGVFHVINDGVRDLAKANNNSIVAGHDDGIYLLRPQRFLRLGDDELHRWAAEADVDDFEVAPDGTVWASPLESFDGEEWTHDKAVVGTTFDMTPEGTLWAFWEDPEQESGQPQVFAHLDEDGWQTLGHLDNVQHLLVAGLDDIWATAGLWPENYLHRFVDGAWQRLVGFEGTEPTWQPAEELVADDAVRFDWGPDTGVGLGPDGTLWGVRVGGDYDLLDLVRFDGSGWSRWSLDDSLLDTGFMLPYNSPLRVAPDGGVWFMDPSDDSCEGVGHFDGVTPDRFLSDFCVKTVDITADGAVWLLANEPDADLRHVYVITPEAVAATE